MRIIAPVVQGSMSSWKVEAFGCGGRRIPAPRNRDMAVEHLPHSVGLRTNVALENPECSTVESCNRKLKVYRRREARLREALARDDALLHQKDELIQNQALMSNESEHRLLNDLQVIVSLLSLQSRSSPNAEVASQLATAADRIATIARIHRRLHFSEGVQSVAFKQFLDDLCGDFSTMLSSDQNPDRAISVEGVEVKLPSATAIPLGFIVNELITNAAKYGKGLITVRLERNSGSGYALSVANDGPALTEGFDPAAGKGMGMRIISSFVERIGGALQIARGDNNRGARFTVQFS
jgi:two-component system, sensor histidine kinase PdtaS